MNRKDKPKTKPERIEDAIKEGRMQIVTDPAEVARLVAKERHEMGYRNHTDKPKDNSDNDLKYSDAVYSIDPHYKGLVQ